MLEKQGFFSSWSAHERDAQRGPLSRAHPFIIARLSNTQITQAVFMKISVSHTTPLSFEGDLLIITRPQAEALTELEQAINTQLGGALERKAQRALFVGKRAQQLLIDTNGVTLSELTKSDLVEEPAPQESAKVKRSGRAQRTRYRVRRNSSRGARTSSSSRRSGSSQTLELP